MIKYVQYEDKYQTQAYNLIHNIMKTELKIKEETLQKITKDLVNIKEYYIDNYGNFWLAVDDETDNVVGTVAIRKIDEVNAEFKRFYVEKDYRNKKIGYELYRMAETYAKNNGFKYLYLASGKDLKKAHRIYGENGWQLIDKNKKEINIFVRDEARLFRKKIFEDEKSDD